MGYGDVDEWLETIEPSTLNKLIALARVQPFGDDQLTRLVHRLLAADGAELGWDELRQRDEQPDMSDADRQRMLESILRR